VDTVVAGWFHRHLTGGTDRIGRRELAGVSGGWLANTLHRTADVTAEDSMQKLQAGHLDPN
jgi:hypothetical protein